MDFWLPDIYIVKVTDLQADLDETRTALKVGQKITKGKEKLIHRLPRESPRRRGLPRRSCG